MTLVLAALAAVVVAVCSFQYSIERSVRRHRASVLSGRTEQSDAEFYREAFQDSDISPELVAKIRGDIGAALEVDSRLLRPDDQLDSLFVQSGFAKQFDDAVDEVYFLLKEAAERRGAPVDMGRLKTIRDIIVVVGAH